MRADTKGKHGMGKRFAIVIGVAALGAAVIAAGASADFSSVNDPRGDARCVRELRGHRSCSEFRWSPTDLKRIQLLRREADIIRATAGHESRRLRHTVRVVGKIRAVHFLINTDSDPACEWGLFAGRGRETSSEFCVGQDPRHSHFRRHARVNFHFHSVEISFSRSSIGNPASYGWTAYTFLGDSRATVLDHVPNGPPLFHYIEHSLG